MHEFADVDVEVSVNGDFAQQIVNVFLGQRLAQCAQHVVQITRRDLTCSSEPRQGQLRHLKRVW